MKKTVQIVIIPLDKRSWTEEELLKDDANHFRLIVYSRGIDVKDWKPQQLLVLSDDEIREDDTYYASGSKSFEFSVHKCQTIRLAQIAKEFNAKKIIASYPQLPNTLPISKETIQQWIDSGTPGEGEINLVDDTKFDLKKGWSDVGKTKEETSFISNLLLEFGKKDYDAFAEGITQMDTQEQIINNRLQSKPEPSIPTDEEIEEKAKSGYISYYNANEVDGLVEEYPYHFQEHYTDGFANGYKQALKDQEL